MAVDIDDIHAISAATVQLYRETELELLRLIARYLADGIDAPTWAEERLAAVTALRRAAQFMLGELEVNTAPEIRQHLAEAYRTGYGAALAASELAQLAPDVTDAAQAATSTVTRVAAMESLAASVVRDIGVRSRNVARHVIDVYRAVVLQASALSIAGGLTRRQASQEAYARLVDQGVTSFTDAAGRRWRLSSYVEMALRTVTQRAAVQGQEDRQTSLGLDLMLVSDSPGECPLCRPFEHKILSISGAHRGRVQVPSVVADEMVTVDVLMSVTEARAAGLWHPNCTHSGRSYLPGATTIPTGPTADPELYKAKDRQRAIERHIRGWKEREAAALTPDAKTRARVKVRAWQQEMRDHLAANPKLKRLPYREQIGGGNLPKPPPGAGAATPKPTPRKPTPLAPINRPQDAVPIQWWYDKRAAVGVPEGQANRQAITDALTKWVYDKRPSTASESIAESRTNSALRGLDPLNDEQLGTIAALDQAMDLSRTDRPLTLWRGFSDGRGILPPDWATRSLVGLTWTNRGFTSMTDDRDAAEAYTGPEDDRGFMIQVELPAGFSAVAIRDTTGGLDDEGEIVIPRDLEFTITEDLGVQGDYNLRLLRAKVRQLTHPEDVPLLGAMIDQGAAAFRSGGAETPYGVRLDPTPFRRILAGDFPGGLDVTIDHAVYLEGSDTIQVAGTIRQDGAVVGQFTRQLGRKPDGTLVATHNTLRIDPGVQGSGFAAAFNGRLIAWYRRSGVDRVDLHANDDVGGYAWARAGYDFADAAAEADWRFEAGRFTRRLLGLEPESQLAGTKRADLGGLFPGLSQAQIDGQLQSMLNLMDEAQHRTILPYEYSQLGRRPGQGKADMWIGKLIMMGTDWHGTLRL